MSNFRHFTQTIDPRANENVVEDKSSTIDLPSSRKFAIAKLEILERYRSLFTGASVESLNIQPILWTRVQVLVKMEAIYDHLVESLLKQRRLPALDINKAVHATLWVENHESINHLYQSIADLVYSIDKYREYAEMVIFSGFMRGQTDLYPLLFYLYMRQHFKVISYTNFLSHKKTERDPSKISITLNTVIDIIKVSLSFDTVILHKFISMFNSTYSSQQRIGYYDFMVSCCTVKINHKDLPMIERLLALYNNSSIFDEIQESSMRMKTGPLKSPKKKQRNDEQDFDPENDDEYSFDGTKTPDGQNLIKKAPENNAQGHLNIKQKIMDPKDREIFELIKKEIRSFTFKLASGFARKYKVNTDVIEEKLDGVVNQIFKKIYYIVSSVFISDRTRFMSLLRIADPNDEDAHAAWVDLHETINQLKRFPVTNRSLAKEFLYKVFKLPSMQDEVEFFLNFHFENDANVMDTNVDLSDIM